MNFGLREKDVQSLSLVFRKHPTIRRVLIFGSRARGTHGRASDVDLAVEAPEMTDVEFRGLKESLEAAPLIFGLDVVRLDGLEDVALKEAILRDGKPLE